MLEQDQIVRFEEDRPFDHVLQLPNISRPVVFLQPASGRRRKAADVPRKFAIEIIDEERGENRDVLQSLPERRKMNRDDLLWAAPDDC